MTTPRPLSNLEHAWTPERVETLRRLWAEGWSCSEIALRLGGGLTRNAVIGKVHRLADLPKRMRGQGGGRPRSAAPKLRPPRAPRVPPAAQPVLKPKPEPEFEPEPAFAAIDRSAAWRPLPGTTPLRLEDLPREGRCRWPVDPPRLDDRGLSPPIGQSTKQTRLDDRGLSPPIGQSTKQTRPDQQSKAPLGQSANERRPFYFCGADTLAGSYCPTHTRLSRGNGTTSERQAHKIGAKVR